MVGMCVEGAGVTGGQVVTENRSSRARGGGGGKTHREGVNYIPRHTIENNGRGRGCKEEGRQCAVRGRRIPTALPGRRGSAALQCRRAGMESCGLKKGSDDNAEPRPGSRAGPPIP